MNVITNCIVEVSVPTIILFCVIRKDVNNLYKWETFWPKGLQSEPDPHAKSGSDEDLLAEMSAIYVNYQHLCGLNKRE